MGSRAANVSRKATRKGVPYSVARLNDVQNGFSRGYADLKKDELMSNKYLVIVYGSLAPDAKVVSCGQLFT